MVAVTSNVVVSMTEIESALVLLMNRLAAAAGRRAECQDDRGEQAER
jgi:hypothetical protein